MTAPAPQPATQQFNAPPGIVALTTHGMAVADTLGALLEMRSFSERQGLLNVQWQIIHGALVDKARNEAARTLLKSQGQWLLFCDLDMVMPPEALVQLVYTAYATHPHYDVLGSYCNLRGQTALPTIDTGTGTWESWFPGQGVVEVMRTGAAFLLIKRHVFERLPDPWFALRVPMRPLDAISEVDTYCRTIFNGQNPFRGRDDLAWERMTECASQDRSLKGPWVPGEVGEDSSFCDRVTGAGMRIGVQTDIVLRHLTTVAQGWEDHKRSMDDRARQDRFLVGMTA